MTAPIRIIDCDTHVSEPIDLWTSRIGRKWGDKAPRTVRDEQDREFWMIGDKRLVGSGQLATAGWPATAPAYPPSLDKADPASWEPNHRLQRMDEYGLYAQVLYPNILAFYMPVFFKEVDLELTLDCVRAYNDFLVDFCSTDTKRLIPLMMLPFWDVDLSIEEMKRCERNGHRGIVFANRFDRIGLPELWNEHWTPIFDMAQHLEMSINFHVGFGALSTEDMDGRASITGAEHSRVTPIQMIANAQAVADITTMGICHRFPRLKFVSVESGVGWIPYMLESLDWHWLNYGGNREHPDMMLPSEYFQRQIYGSFWFEQRTLPSIVEFVADNVMFESDFPHPTSLSPGPASTSDAPAEMLARSLRGVSAETAHKIIYANAAKLYHLD
jgi:uncharacterized protein